MGKQPGDGKPNITKAEQDALKTDQEKADEATVKAEGLPGLNTIAQRNQEGG
jgi:hypothetical protein